MADYVDRLSDAELRTKLAEYGFPIVPITTTTRKVMAKKLKMLIENKNKINTEGRRSLAKYSSEEESDDDVKIKKRENRRVTVAAGMLPPAVKSPRKTTTRKPDIPPTEDRVFIPVAPTTTGATNSRTITTETKTKRTTRIIKPVVEEDLEIGSDSEPEIIDEFIDHEHEAERPKVYSTEPVIKPYNSPSFSYLSRPSFQSGAADPPKQSYISSRFTSTDVSSAASNADNSFERLNQIRSRLSLANNDKYSDLSAGRSLNNYAGNGEEVSTNSTPFLSNFSKRLSQLSNTLPKSEFNYKNDVIKEHDTNNGSSYATKNYLSRIRNRDYPMDFKASQEKNIFKNNIVSFTLLGVAILFFLFLGMMYVGIRSDQPAIAETIDYVLPICEKIKSPKPGLNCVPDADKSDTINLWRVLVPELTKRAIAEKCSDSGIKSAMDEDDVIRFVTTNYALQDPFIIRTCLRNLQLLVIKNPKWKISIIKTEKEGMETALETIEEVLNSASRKNLALIIPDPDLPWKCIIYNKLYTIVISLITIALGFSAMYASQKGYIYYLRQRKIKNDKIYCLVEKIIDILQTNAADNAENFLAVNHVRDMLIPPQERKSMAVIWDGAVKFLQENESRVRTEIQIVSGEEFHVWRWVGTNLNTSSSPRSKTWQGQAFETQSGSVNSLPCSPTSCLKIRGMFDERERNFYTVREAVLNKCAAKCKILHCEVDLTSGCVYLQCLNQAEAAIAYLNLHGWWYDGHLVTVKYLRLNRYMQRFPNCPTKGPPFLTPASAAPNENNEWTNNDD